MTTGAAKEALLGDLHRKVTNVMLGALEVQDKAQQVYMDLDDETAASVIAPVVSAPLLSVVAKFLADNKISCVPEESAEMSELATMLKNKRKRVGNVIHMTGTDD